jgi:uncharacterized membrane protein YkoI
MSAIANQEDCMTSRTLKTVLVAVGLAAAGVGMTAIASGQTPSHSDAKLAAQAKVTVDAARVSALRAQPGTVKDWELEKESGGSGLRYSFDIESSGKMHEIGVDAADGKVIENIVETAADEAREAREDKAHGNDADDAEEEGEEGGN